ncbi:PLP-dependent aminotransferase family protein [Rhizobium sp.]|jgi:(S)-3,5-dihydroxyphenylglycine transaminase|uniref:aminotransferase-like domain-containing protein n=1 Tax=Rhizobium sp. TaxID=391 RepID=UPI000E7FA7F0|nr:PLP-dependent aminotransferase family protein [Rhizobium sp.]
MVSLAQSDVMNFLNEIASEYPEAISLAAGRPTERLFDRLSPQRLAEALGEYQSSSAKGPLRIDDLLQYGRTAGVIPDLIAAQLRTDQMVAARPNELLVTSGCQEALMLCLASICGEPNDILLLPNPTYVGAVGAAQACQVRTWPLEPGDLPEAIEKAAVQIGKAGRVPKALYLIPDFDNPTGNVISEAKRREIIELCKRHRILVLEDSAYSLFNFDGQSILPMAAMDDAGCVIHLSTYSKTICPGVRVGAATLPETLFGSRDDQLSLWKALVQRKSYITVNTSSICQAIVGGLLLDQKCSLLNWIDPALRVYRTNRDVMLKTIERTFAPYAGVVGWNRPAGGFFLALDLPFDFDVDAVVECATEYGVIVMPMAFFAFDDSQSRSVRLSFSAVTPDQISTAVEAFGRYVATRISRRAVA